MERRITGTPARSRRRRVERFAELAELSRPLAAMTKSSGPALLSERYGISRRAAERHLANRLERRASTRRPSRTRRPANEGRRKAPASPRRPPHPRRRARRRAPAPGSVATRTKEPAAPSLFTLRGVGSAPPGGAPSSHERAQKATGVRRSGRLRRTPSPNREIFALDPRGRRRPMRPSSLNMCAHFDPYWPVVASPPSRRCAGWAHFTY